MRVLIKLVNRKYCVAILTIFFAMGLFMVFIGGAVPVVLQGYSDKNKSITRKFIEDRDKVSSDLRRAIKKLNSMKFDEECGSDMLKAMRYAQFEATYIKDVGYSNNNKLLCTSGLGKLERPFDEVPPHVVTPDGGSVWLNVPIKFYNFEKKAHVLKIEHYNTVYNIGELDRNAEQFNNVAFYMIRNDGKPYFLQGNKDITSSVWANNTTYGLRGMTSVYCSDLSYICSVAYTSYLDVIKNEKSLLFGIMMLSLLSTIFITKYFYELAKKMSDIKFRFRHGMTYDRVLCYYQPIVELSTLKITGFEVLCRWVDFDDKVQTPDKFLHLVKQLGWTREFTEIIIRKTYDELDDLLRKHKQLKISFNIFPSDFDAEIINSMLSRYKARFPLSTINLELTEDELIQLDEVSGCTDMLRSKGYKVSIDDFGTGYSSLSYLRDIKVDFIKIDRSFVKEIEHGAIKANLIPNIVAIADNLGCQVIAEGIEVKEQIDYLASFNVLYGQGYLFSKPCPADEFAALFCGDTLC